MTKPSKKHMHGSTILGMINVAFDNFRKWDRVEHHQWAADDFKAFGFGIARLADERDAARKSQQRMHKEVRALTGTVEALNEAIMFKDASIKRQAETIQQARHMTSHVCNKILELVDEGALQPADAGRIFEEIGANGFLPNHRNFAEGLKRLAYKVDDPE